MKKGQPSSSRGWSLGLCSHKDVSHWRPGDRWGGHHRKCHGGSWNSRTLNTPSPRTSCQGDCPGGGGAGEPGSMSCVICNRLHLSASNSYYLLFLDIQRDKEPYQSLQANKNTRGRGVNTCLHMCREKVPNGKTLTFSPPVVARNGE